MHRIALHYDVDGWAYHRRCLALMKYAPPDLSVHLGNGRAHDRREQCDLALQLCYSHCRDLRRAYRKKQIHPLIVAGINVGPTERNIEWLSRAFHDGADHVIVNSHQMYEAAKGRGRVSWISNGVDRDVFHVRRPITDRPRQVLWCGSLFHRTTKGYDDYLIPLARRLWRDGIKCDFRLADSHGGPSRWTIDRMAEWYQTGAVYVCASRVEGTPNPAIEAAASGCTIVSTRVGNMPELIEDGVNGLLVDRDVDALYAAVHQALERYQEFAGSMQERIVAWGWDQRAGQYYDLFRQLLAAASNRSTRRP